MAILNEFLLSALRQHRDTYHVSPREQDLLDTLADVQAKLAIYEEVFGEIAGADESLEDARKRFLSWSTTFYEMKDKLADYHKVCQEHVEALDSMKALLAPSPCGKEGHPMAAWVEGWCKAHNSSLAVCGNVANLNCEKQAPYCRICREQEQLRDEKHGAYAERNNLVAALSKLFPASLERHPDEDTSWDDEWRWVVYIDLPSGQVSWHIRDSEVTQFDHLKRFQGRKWDGHTTPEKYARLEALTGREQEQQTQAAVAAALRQAVELAHWIRSTDAEDTAINIRDHILSLITEPAAEALYKYGDEVWDKAYDKGWEHALNELKDDEELARRERIARLDAYKDIEMLLDGKIDDLQRQLDAERNAE